ncbi:TPA: hypothetical protein PXO68_000593 [Yersinia enterocolitica]|nr:hypothetical protein [Yersinia enterocolitica]HDL7606953.1 hypothetical protein [Yersinia enterocolitica]HDL7615303.1 hypothetical protein [Yersinia enterocolitica]HDL7649506.1 hypothetical protein [Yersinia enterocolitica]HDL7670314.1 hypothetical protein [Yersinia enterocolitica]
MQDKIYASEIANKIEYKKIKGEIPVSLYNHLKDLINEGEFEKAENLLELSDDDFEKDKYFSFKYMRKSPEETSDLMLRMDSLKSENIKLQNELNRRTREFSKINEKTNLKIKTLEEKHKKEIQEKVKTNVPDYVENATTKLTEKEVKLKKTATVWTWIGFSFLLLAVFFSILSITWGYKEFTELPAERITWMWIAFGLIKGACLLIILFGVAAYALNLSKAYMHESLKLSDRIHAINLGEVYLKIYGHSVSSQEFKDIFENWNISSNSAFHTNSESPDYNRAILQKALEEALPTQLIKTFVSMKSLSKE